ncbi:MAG: cyclase family protein [Clostridia bacterium]|nr:cyclase family protein [Clostridia bacterium]
MKIIDITREILSCPVYPGDPVANLERVKSIDSECQYNLSEIRMCLHNGTHIDAPLHFLPDGEDITEIPHEVFFGPCVVVETDTPVITGAFVEEYFPRNSKRILVKSNGVSYFHESAASALADIGITLLGTDGMTVEPEESDGRSHRTFMMNNITLLENLDLSNVKSGDYFLSAAPLKISGAEAGPVRAFLVSDFIFWSGDNK